MKTKYGGKITVDIPNDIDRAVGDGARDIVNYCGLIVRTPLSHLEMVIGQPFLPNMDKQCG